MLAIHDGVSRATQDYVSWQLAVGGMIGDALVQGLRQMADLNMGMLRVTLEQGNLVARQLASARDTRQLMSLAEAQLQPGASLGLDYGYYLASILAGMQSGVIRAFGRNLEPGREENVFAPLLGDPLGWRCSLSFIREAAESAWRFPADVARAARLALNINAPASESGKLRIAYAGPGRARM